MHSGTKTYLPLPKSANVARDDRISAATARLSAMGLRGVVAMAERVLVSDRGTTSGGPTTHPTAAFAPYRRRSARAPAPGPSTATQCPVHRQLLGLH